MENFEISIHKKDLIYRALRFFFGVLQSSLEWCLVAMGTTEQYLLLVCRALPYETIAVLIIDTWKNLYKKQASIVPASFK